MEIREVEEAQEKLWCNLCDNNVLDWAYIGEDREIFHYKKIIGASRRKGGCPVCGSSDRIRYVYYIMRKYTNLLDGFAHDVLHFAPEEILSSKVRALCGNNYISADLMSANADVAADITNLQFADEQFEYIICNHVMEHIVDEEKAFSELRRCLKAGGILILTVPICWEQKTFEASDVKTEEDRIKNYGQADHVRLYGNDIVSRVEKFGFSVNLYVCNQVVDRNRIRKFGYIERDSVLLCKRAE